MISLLLTVAMLGACGVCAWAVARTAHEIAGDLRREAAQQPCRVAALPPTTPLHARRRRGRMRSRAA
jgi:hypothetical protein